MSDIKVSAIVPVYNVPEQYLRQCVNSLVNQTLKEIEIILVDDGTPNTSGIICDELAKTDNRIKVIHQENKGLCGARNSGVRAANGEWISFIDGDDFIENNAYSILYEEATSNNLDVVVFGYIKDYPSRSVTMGYDKYFNYDKIYKDDEVNYIKKMILNYNANCAMVPTKFINKKFILDNDLFHDEVLRQGAEGIEFNVRLFSVAKRVKILNQSLYHYIYNDESITTVHNEKNHYMVLGCFKKIKENIDVNDKDFIKLFNDRMKYVILTTAISGYFSSSNREKYSIQKRKYNLYLNENIIQEVLIDKDDSSFDFFRKMTLFFIRKKLFCFVKLISKVRTYQKGK